VVAGAETGAHSRDDLLGVRYLAPANLGAAHVGVALRALDCRPLAGTPRRSGVGSADGTEPSSRLTWTQNPSAAPAEIEPVGAAGGDPRSRLRRLIEGAGGNVAAATNARGGRTLAIQRAERRH